MKKLTILIIVLVAILILTGCATPRPFGTIERHTARAIEGTWQEENFIIFERQPNFNHSEGLRLVLRKISLNNTPYEYHIWGSRFRNNFDFVSFESVLLRTDDNVHTLRREMSNTTRVENGRVIHVPRLDGAHRNWVIFVSDEMIDEILRANLISFQFDEILMRLGSDEIRQLRTFLRN